MSKTLAEYLSLCPDIPFEERDASDDGPAYWRHYSFRWPGDYSAAILYNSRTDTVKSIDIQFLSGFSKLPNFYPDGVGPNAHMGVIHESVASDKNRVSILNNFYGKLIDKLHISRNLTELCKKNQLSSKPPCIHGEYRNKHCKVLLIMGIDLSIESISFSPVKHRKTGTDSTSP